MAAKKAPAPTAADAVLTAAAIVSSIDLGAPDEPEAKAAELRLRRVVAALLAEVGQAFIGTEASANTWTANASRIARRVGVAAMAMRQEVGADVDPFLPSLRGEDLSPLLKRARRVLATPHVQSFASMPLVHAEAARRMVRSLARVDERFGVLESDLASVCEILWPARTRGRPKGWEHRLVALVELTPDRPRSRPFGLRGDYEKIRNAIHPNA